MTGLAPSRPTLKAPSVLKSSGSWGSSPSKLSNSLGLLAAVSVSPHFFLQVGHLVHDVNEDFLRGPVARLLPRCDFDLNLRIGLEEVRGNLS